MTGTLTVRENLMFSANLRLPSDISQKEKVQRVEDTLYELGLEKCADSKVCVLFIILIALLYCQIYHKSIILIIQPVSNNFIISLSSLAVDVILILIVNIIVIVVPFVNDIM